MPLNLTGPVGVVKPLAAVRFAPAARRTRVAFTRVAFAPAGYRRYVSQTKVTSDATHM
jgi:hypothetical protein